MLTNYHIELNGQTWKVRQKETRPKRTKRKRKDKKRKEEAQGKKKRKSERLESHCGWHTSVRRIFCSVCIIFPMYKVISYTACDRWVYHGVNPTGVTWNIHFSDKTVLDTRWEFNLRNFSTIWSCGKLQCGILVTSRRRQAPVWLAHIHASKTFLCK